MKVYEFYQDKDHFYIVSEYYNGGELFDKIARMKFFSEKRAAITMKQVLSAISYCHQHKIVHRYIIE
jgi:calcium-dependent protein kinase